MGCLVTQDSGQPPVDGDSPADPAEAMTVGKTAVENAGSGFFAAVFLYMGRRGMRPRRVGGKGLPYWIFLEKGGEGL